MNWFGFSEWGLFEQVYFIAFGAGSLVVMTCFIQAYWRRNSTIRAALKKFKQKKVKIAIRMKSEALFSPKRNGPKKDIMNT